MLSDKFTNVFFKTLLIVFAFSCGWYFPDIFMKERIPTTTMEFYRDTIPTSIPIPTSPIIPDSTFKANVYDIGCFGRYERIKKCSRHEEVIDVLRDYSNWEHIYIIINNDVEIARDYVMRHKISLYNNRK